MKKIGRFLVVTVSLIAISTFCITSTVMSHSNRDLRIAETYYHQMEQEYVKEIKSCLREKGYENSGVMMTRVVDENGKREYTITIHNKRINKLSEEEKKNLQKELIIREFDAPDCIFYHEFLEA